MLITFMLAQGPSATCAQTVRGSASHGCCYGQEIVFGGPAVNFLPWFVLADEGTHYSDGVILYRM